jgi:prevent-host-death family protein
MWSQMGIRELRDNLTEAIRRVANGDSIEVTRDGTPVALISPVPASRVDRLVAVSGSARPVPLARPIRRHRVTGPVTATEALEDDRAER